MSIATTREGAKVFGPQLRERGGLEDYEWKE